MLGYQAESASAKQVNRGFVHCAVKAEWCVKKNVPKEEMKVHRKVFQSVHYYIQEDMFRPKVLPRRSSPGDSPGAHTTWKITLPM